MFIYQKRSPPGEGMDLTKKQQAILAYIKSYIQDHSYPPSVRDIAAHFNLASAGGVHKHLKNLEERGFLALDSNISRGIRVLNNEAPPPIAVVELPLKGKVAAGKPISFQLDNETLAFPEYMVRRADRSFVLQVQGDSMIDEYIQSGDYVIVESREVADNGEMVVALLDGEEATLKRFFKEGAQVRLQPSNQAMEPIIVAAERVSLQGVVVGVYRRY